LAVDRLGPPDEEANHSGSYTYDLTGAKFPRIQIITVPEILKVKRPAGPAHPGVHPGQAEPVKLFETRDQFFF
jgi:hypothetical protein